MKIKTYKPSEINSCREASKISAAILDELNHLIAVGITTDEIDNFCLDRIKKLGGLPAPLFYRGFPKSSQKNGDMQLFGGEGYHPRTRFKSFRSWAIS